MSSVVSAVSPALHMFSNRRFHNPFRAWVDKLCEVANIYENLFGFTLQQVGSVSNTFLIIVSYQPPLKIIVGWILIDLFHLRLGYLDLNLFQIEIFP